MERCCTALEFSWKTVPWAWIGRTTSSSPAWWSHKLECYHYSQAMWCCFSSLRYRVGILWSCFLHLFQDILCC